MEQDQWRDRLTYRSDLVARVTHLTGSHTANDDVAFQALWKILTEKKLIGSGNDGYIIGNKRAVCFQEVPLMAMAENLWFGERLGTPPKYRAFGLRVNRGALYKKGGRPVLYGERDKLKAQIPQYEHWRIVSMDLEKSDDIVDWTHEREWRYPGDFSFEWSEIEILLKDHNYYTQFVEKCFAEDMTDLLKSVNGIITLDSVIS